MLREAVSYVAFAILWLFGYARVSPSPSKFLRLRACPFPVLFLKAYLVPLGNPPILPFAPPQARPPLSEVASCQET